jgi:3D (Asp-Asp-Asp) domain-containing protein
MVFDGCVHCDHSGGCGVCRKSLQLKGTAWKILLQDGAIHDDTEMPKGTRVAVEDGAYGLATIDGFRANVVGANNHSMVFDNCQTCPAGSGGCDSCRKSLQLKGTRWKMLKVDGSVHDDTQLPAGTRVVVENVGYGLATIDGFRANVIGANNHSMVFDNCQTCPAGSGGCGACRKSLQLRGTPWRVVWQDGNSRGDHEMAAGSRIVVEDAAYGLATIDGFRANVIGANNHSMVFDNCQTCPAGSGGCGACRKSLQLQGLRWKYWKRVNVDHGDATDAVEELQLQDGATHDDTELPKGTRVAVFDHGYGMATVVDFQGALIGANTHDIIYDNCLHCTPGSDDASAGQPEQSRETEQQQRASCDICRRRVQLKNMSWKVLGEDAPTEDGPMARGTRVAVYNQGYGIATIDGFRANLVGANNHSMVFDGCVLCDHSGGCGVCRKSLQLKDTAWKMLKVDGSVHDDTEMPKGSRIVVEDAAYGLGTIDGFRANMIGANNHSMVFDNCQTCPAGSGGCGACRKSLQLKGMRWKILMKDGASHDDQAMGAGTRVLVEEAAYGVATIRGFSSALLGANTHELMFDNCPACAHQRKKGCTLCRKALQLKGIEWSTYLLRFRCQDVLIAPLPPVRSSN